MTFATVMAVLVVIAFILRKKRPQMVPSEREADGSTMTDEARRYEIDDFLT